MMDRSSLVRLLAIPLLFVTAPVAAQTYTVSGATFDKFQKSGSDEQDRRDVSRVDHERPDPPENTGPSAREIEREKAAEARARAKRLQAIELQRVKDNEQLLFTRLSEAAARPTSPPPALVLDNPPDPAIAARRKSLQAVIESPEERVPVLRQQAREEWYWFTTNHLQLMWAGLGAAAGVEAVDVFDASPREFPDPADDTAREAREHLSRYLELVKELESITHTREFAEQHYQERVRRLTVQRSGDYNVNTRDSTAKTDIYPPNDTFAPWSEDEIIQRGIGCLFDASGRLSCGK